MYTWISDHDTLDIEHRRRKRVLLGALAQYIREMLEASSTHTLLELRHSASREEHAHMLHTYTNIKRMRQVRSMHNTYACIAYLTYVRVEAIRVHVSMLVDVIHVLVDEI